MTQESDSVINPVSSGSPLQRSEHAQFSPLLCHLDSFINGLDQPHRWIKVTYLLWLCPTYNIQALDFIDSTSLWLPILFMHSAKRAFSEIWCYLGNCKWRSTRSHQVMVCARVTYYVDRGPLNEYFRYSRPFLHCLYIRASAHLCKLSSPPTRVRFHFQVSLHYEFMSLFTSSSGFIINGGNFTSINSVQTQDAGRHSFPFRGQLLTVLNTAGTTQVLKKRKHRDSCESDDYTQADDLRKRRRCRSLDGLMVCQLEPWQKSYLISRSCLHCRS